MSDQGFTDTAERFSGDEGEGFAYDPYGTEPYDDPVVDARVEQLETQVQQMGMEREAEELVSEFPELAEEANAAQLIVTSRQLAEYIGQPELAENVRFWRLTRELLGAANAGGHDDSRQHDPLAEVFEPKHLGRRCLPF
jgi:hypothetical protein